MKSLIGDRFLKRFFGSCLHQRRVNPVSEAMILPANETDKPDEPDYTPRGNPPDMDATLENEQTGEINQLAGPEDGSGQPAEKQGRFVQGKRELTVEARLQPKKAKGARPLGNALEQQGIQVIYVEWTPPAGGDQEMIDLLDQLL
jgi:hypothetical protein